MISNIVQSCEEKLKDVIKNIEDIAIYNQHKVLKAFQDNNIALHHFSGSSGYGYDDLGKVKLSSLFASIFHTEDAICSPLITSGTHALCVSLFGILRPGDKFVSITGNVYDSLQTAVSGDNVGSLKEMGVSFDYIDLLDNNMFNYTEIENYMKNNSPRLVYFQRSAGYSNRDTLSISQLKEGIDFVKKINPNVIVFVDNCYGTFSDKLEPTDVGADVCVGSLIKNAGGGLAPTGGYIVGKADLVSLIAGRLFGVGLGMEVGSYSYGYQNYFEGLFIAPSVVKNALKGSCLVGAVLSELGIDSCPQPYTKPNDLIRRITFNDEEKMIKFIQLVQLCSPVDSFVKPVPSEMPGYDSKVIMAAGGFVQGASIEMSCDGPVRPPYTAYFQGGITYEQVKLFANEIVSNIQ